MSNTSSDQSIVVADGKRFGRSFLVPESILATRWSARLDWAEAMVCATVSRRYEYSPYCVSNSGLCARHLRLRHKEFE